MVTKLDSLFDTALKEQVDIEYVSFPSNILGLYYKEDGIPPVIGINKSIISNRKLFTCVLAEELGHHFTTVGDTTAEYYSYADKLIVNKKETQALKWATELLLPINEIKQAVNNKITKFHELAEFLQVTDQFLLARLEFISRQSSYIKLNDSRQLVLTNLPNIYITQLF